jgi:tRNA (cytidine/uridine-2'-O-)-methyltransferase
VFNVILYQPEIPPNTGNIIRLCANTGCNLHLIEPLGFRLDEPRLRRAGLDYHDLVNIKVHKTFRSFLVSNPSKNIIGFSTKGSTAMQNISYSEGCSLLFGPETRGLPESVTKILGGNSIARVPMISRSRSMNLANAAAVVIYEAWRQNGYQGAR